MSACNSVTSAHNIIRFQAMSVFCLRIKMNVTLKMYIRVFHNYSTPLQGVREQLILNQLTYGLPTFGFAGAAIWCFKLFFFYKIPVHFYMHLFQWIFVLKKFTNNHFYRKFKKKKLMCKQFFVFILSSEVICQNLAIFIKIFLIFPNF